MSRIENDALAHSHIKMHEGELHILEQTVHAMPRCTNSITHASLTPPAPPLPPNHDPTLARHFTHTYRWHSALRSNPGCIRTFRLCRFRARCSVGDTPVDRTRRPSSPRHSDSCPPRRCRVHHSRLRTALWDTRKGGGL